MANLLLQNDYEDVVGFDLQSFQPGCSAPILQTTGALGATRSQGFLSG